MKRNKFLTVLVIITLAACVGTMTACNSEKTARIFDFGTFIEINLKGKNASNSIDGLTSLFNNMDARFDAENEGSDVYKINRAAADEEITVSDQTYFLLELSKKMYGETDGYFNVATYGLSKLWKFDSLSFNEYATDYVLPTAEAIAEELQHCNLDNLVLLGANKVKKNDGDLKIGFGAIVKGYAGDLAYEKDLIKEGQTGIVNVGGTIFTVGGKNYAIGIGNPRDSEFSYFAKLDVKGGSVVCTSGDYYRYYTVDGKRYCHIFGKDGYPGDNGVISVTVLSENGAASGAMCDVLSTSVFALGKERGVELAKKYSVGLVIIYADKTYELVDIPDGIFTLKDTGYTQNV